MLITYETRIKIESLLKEGYSLANIARRLNFSRSTITREIRRGTQDSPKNNLNYLTNLIKSMYRARDASLELKIGVIMQIILLRKFHRNISPRPY
ncbi:helix-turn-helix domain-containing protein [Weissella paramesenteroides]